jgi:uncharacterized membrane protein
MIFADAGIFIGRFHPLLVHLPIGFLLLAALLEIIGRKEKYLAIKPAVSFSLLLGSISAVLACITGYLLSYSGDYDQDTLTVHMWGGITTAIVSLIAYLLSIGFISSKIFKKGRAIIVTLFVMVAMISITGHFGGTLTHGPGYISPDILFGKQQGKRLITDINDAVIYEDIVQPILEKKCSNCHNSGKKKGELSMQNYLTLMKGGKHGAVIEAGHANKSELVTRINLPPKDEKYMPADGKPSLTEDEKNILSWWIDKAGASVTKKVKEAQPAVNIKNEITAYLGLQEDDKQEDDNADSTTAYFAQLNIPAINVQQLVVLKRAGFVIKYINLKPLLLDVTLPENKSAVQDSVDAKIKELLLVKDNIAWLNVSGNNISDKQLEMISRFKNLQRLRLDNNPVTDDGVRKLQTLVNLESINLYNTKVTNRTVEILTPLVKLRHLYVWGTGVTKDGKDAISRVVF